MVTRPLSGFRFVEILYDDTIQRIAARALNDASRWPELVAINNLSPPYLTNDPSIAGDRVKLYGQQLVVPAAAAQVATEIDPERVFGRDLDLSGGELSDNGLGDFALIAGQANLAQGLKHRIVTGLRELLQHLAYGSGVRYVVGKVNSASAGAIAARYAEDSLKADERVVSVAKVTATIGQGVTAIEARVVTATGSVLNISGEVG